MSNLLGDIPLTCPNCGHTFTMDITTEKNPICPDCGLIIDAQEVKKAIDDFNRSFDFD